MVGRTQGLPSVELAGLSKFGWAWVQDRWSKLEVMAAFSMNEPKGSGWDELGVREDRSGECAWVFCVEEGAGLLMWWERPCMYR